MIAYASLIILDHVLGHVVVDIHTLDITVPKGWYMIMSSQRCDWPCAKVLQGRCPGSAPRTFCLCWKIISCSGWPQGVPKLPVAGIKEKAAPTDRFDN